VLKQKPLASNFDKMSESLRQLLIQSTFFLHGGADCDTASKGEGGQRGKRNAEHNSTPEILGA
jgi:hypothetical protein